MFQESLEARIAELEEALEAAKRTELRDKQTLAKLQKQLQRVSRRNVFKWDVRKKKTIFLRYVVDRRARAHVCEIVRTCARLSS